jgi:two-component system response regulator GlrR
MREVLLVDDDRSFVHTMGALLQRHGYTVVADHDCRSALDYLDEHRPDLVITDLRLNRGSGWDLVDYARTHQPDLPVVVVTGFVEEWEQVAAHKGTPVLLKPFEPEDLLGFVNGLTAHDALSKS